MEKWFPIDLIKQKPLKSVGKMMENNPDEPSGHSALDFFQIAL